MPAFTFEKISPREHRGSRPFNPQQNQSQQQPTSTPTSTPPARMGVIQVLGRFVEARVDRFTSTDRLPPRQK